MKPLTLEERRTRLHHNSSGEPDARSPFEKDCDRILYSPEFRRLQGVTQVVGPHEGEVFHNRLTHSLKVAQTGKRLAQRLVEDWRDNHGDDLIELGILDPDVVEAACLAHDIGHPPFGHVAEAHLWNLLWDKGRGDPDCFEGNAQSFRIVTKLAALKPKVAAQGLGLTYATINALVKYPYKREPKWDPGEKYGYFRTEQAEFDAIRCGRNGKGKTLEAQIMDFADDVAYSFHDFHDFYRARLIPVGALANKTTWLPLVKDWGEYAIKRYSPHIPEDVISDFVNSDYITDAFRVFLFDPDGYEDSYADRADLHALIAREVGETLNDPWLEENDGEWSLCFSNETYLRLKLLQRVVWIYVIENPALASQHEGQRRIIGELYRVFLKALTDSEPQPLRLIPSAILTEEFETKAKHKGLTEGERRRIACDAICALTDQQAIQLYGRYMGVEPGSVFSMIL